MCTYIVYSWSCVEKPQKPLQIIVPIRLCSNEQQFAHFGWFCMSIANTLRYHFVRFPPNLTNSSRRHPSNLTKWSRRTKTTSKSRAPKLT